VSSEWKILHNQSDSLTVDYRPIGRRCERPLKRLLGRYNRSPETEHLMARRIIIFLIFLNWHPDYCAPKGPRRR